MFVIIALLSLDVDIMGGISIWNNFALQQPLVVRT